jgi:hypothetical protein
MKYRNVLRGVYLDCAIVAFMSLTLFIDTSFSYNGMCGGFLPGLAAPVACSFWDYASGHTVLYALILIDTFWPLLLALLFVPPLVGYILDRRRGGDVF